VLENGELKLQFRPAEGAFVVTYYEHTLPVAPRSYAAVLTVVSERLATRLAPDDAHLIELQSILTSINNLPTRAEVEPARIQERNREKEVVKRRLAALVESAPDIRVEIEAEVERLNGTPGERRSFDALDLVLRDQAYRLAFWRVAAEEINYRRFFDINTLAALRMENPVVFAETHRLIFRLLGEGMLTGLRIDHPDGLWDPEQYFLRLQAAYRHVTGQPPPPNDPPFTAEDVRAWDAAMGRPLLDTEPDETPHGGPSTPPAVRIGGGSPQPDRPLYVLAEKILAKDEPLPEEWAVCGTTGYDFMNVLGGIFVDGGARRRFDDLYARFIGERIDFNDLVYQCKLTIMRTSLASEVNVLASQLNRLSEADRRSRDFTLQALSNAVREVIACFPVYRTYITGQPVTERDRCQVDVAIAWARRRNPAMEPTVLDFLRDTLLLQPLEGPEAERMRAAQLRFVMKFQQTTGPVTAKAVEDTAFYRYNRLVALNEVGGEPEAFGVSVAAFHRHNGERLRTWPHTMLATSTHDTKRSEDVRARIAVLSELPREWGAAVSRWARLNRRHKQRVVGQPAPSRNDEYLLYQVLLGAWPFGRLEGKARETFVGRIQEYMTKATKEAKVRTSWINPNEGYDAAVRDFVRLILDERESLAFLADFAALQARIAEAGAINSLAQVLLKLTVPGVPDVYQGNELWDFSLVDPDNRRPVDYKLRARHLRDLGRVVGRAEKAGAGRAAPPPLQDLARSLVAQYEDGRIKLYVTWRTLRFRRDCPELFEAGSYAALEAAGRRRDNVCAFSREYGEERIVVAVPRLVTGLLAAFPSKDVEQSQHPGSPDAGGLESPRASTGGGARGPFPAGAWGDDQLLLPDPPGTRYRNLFTGERLETTETAGAAGRAKSALPLGRLFADFPVSLLHREIS
ncbi:MAG: malto-oligosyltrehalose synthase, partial [Chloroflexota bacterium]|nr:malto-oligosyltrehalose synthase [Chloroflexota bacterium]